MSTTLAIELANPTADHEAEQAALAFLTRYGGRTLESCRYDLRSFFQWAADVGLLAATRPHIELFRSSLEERGLAPATIAERAPSERSVCDRHRGPRARTWSPHPSNQGEGRQACRHPARSTSCQDHRPRGRRAVVRADPAEIRWSAPRSSDRPPSAGFDRRAACVVVAYVARAVGESIVTEADDLASLREMVRDAVLCHFDEEERPKLVHLHLVRD